MGGLLRTFAIFGVAGLGWSVGRRVGEKLWVQLNEHYPQYQEQLKKTVDELLGPIRKGKPSAEEDPAQQADTEVSTPETPPESQPEPV